MKMINWIEVEIHKLKKRIDHHELILDNIELSIEDLSKNTKMLIKEVELLTQTKFVREL